MTAPRPSGSTGDSSSAKHALSDWSARRPSLLQEGGDVSPKFAPRLLLRGGQFARSRVAQAGQVAIPLPVLHLLLHEQPGFGGAAFDPLLRRVVAYLPG